MPTYEYTCRKCGQQFDVFQRITEPALKICPKDRCKQKTWGKGAVERGIGAGAGLIFKGSGFYITDYRSEKYKEAAKKDAAPASPPAASDAKSAPAKSETKKTGSGSSSTSAS